MFQRVMWATDGSDAADQALPLAKTLAADGGGKLLVAHCEELTMPGKAGGSFPVHANTGGAVVVVVLVVAGGLLTWGPQLRQLQRPQPARAPGDRLPAEGGLRPRQARDRDHPQHDPVGLAIRRTAAIDRFSG
jgi:Universal stress protein family